MLFEYAVEPQAIGSNWKDFRYLIEKFDFDRGRLISRFPSNWERAVIEAAQRSGMGDVRLKSVVERLQKARLAAIIRTGRQYNPSVDWIENALLQQAMNPFQAIIATQNRGNRNFILIPDDVEDDQPLMVAPRNWEVERTGSNLATRWHLY